MDLGPLHDMMNLAKRAAPEQGGVISGINPIAFTTTDPIRIWIIQLAIILGMTQLLSLVMARIRQPRVIAEVIAGVLLGPTVMGRIPNFTNSIFPAASIPYLSLTATIGLVLFLFLTALEVDVRIMKRNAKSTLFISFAGIIIPFGLGAAVAVPIYKSFVDQSNNFGYFVLFVGVAMSITAFPVLCRILTELKLLDTTVGVVVLSAGVGNDVVGWVLLALTVALVNASGGLTALYVLLASVAWTLFMLYPVKWAFHLVARRTGSLENGQPTPMMMIITLMMVFISAFMTDILGVHAIFGAFIAGLIIPHEGGFAISLVEKLEDFITIILVPIYFTLSGLKTNLGLLNTGKAWGYTILLCAIAFVGKFFGCVAAARTFKFNWRESSTIGVLMSCKGLVELIVLNIGLQAGILDQRLFSMFVVMALVLTFMTTPIVLTIYPPKYRKLGVDAIMPKEKADEEEKVTPPTPAPRDEAGFKSRFSVILNRLEHVPAIMTLTQLLQPSQSSVTLAPSTRGESSNGSNPNIASAEPSVQLDALRLIELTDRTSAVMQSSEADDIIRRDALLSIVRTFGYINAMPVTTSLSVVPYESFSNSVASHAREKESDLVIIPWYAGPEEGAQVGTFNPFENLFGQGRGASNEKSSLAIYSHFVRHVFANNPSDVALFVDRGISLLTEGQQAVHGQHILFPFFGGPDDRLALSFVVQLCANTSITATVLRVKMVERDTLTPTETGETDVKNLPVPHSATVMSHSGFPDTLYAPPTTQTRMESQNADGLAFARFIGGERPALPGNVEAALRRIKFEDLVTSQPLAELIQRANEESATLVQTKKGLLLVVGRGRRMAVASHHAELKTIVQEYTDKGMGRISGDVSRTLGDVATAFMAGVKANLLVMQAAMPAIEE
ncbi:K(+)/H(+) antiporter [Serendipita sp. 396]|nr:K(+)/H(+) antiporter [Serendipita sp. 396]KAG8787022.1 K(+)/H(+) antiporter [Serendipita sp. 397]KAG8801847.1 K(+)/H(+) antiporter [Serendipita sp. 398]KAG8871366.1 K(+)/H(+) antiporter [Serendipita sp. 405]KAG9055108.1 K(+)/H(+) antiporter [Serendipita sp. 407]